MTTEEQSVVDAVRRHIRDFHPGGATLEVLTEGVRHEQDWWYVPIRPSIRPARRYEYYEALATVETQLQKTEHLTVLLIPAPPEETPSADVKPEILSPG